MGHSVWTSERVERLRVLLEAKTPYLVIAAEFGVTKNAIVGKVQRLGLASKPKKPRSPYKKSHKKKKPGKFALDSTPRHHAGYATPVVPVPPPSSIDPSLGISIMDLKHHHCREVIGTGPNKLAIFCGAPKIPYPIQYSYGTVRSSYCEYHARINYKQGI